MRTRVSMLLPACFLLRAEGRAPPKPDRRSREIRKENWQLVEGTVSGLAVLILDDHPINPTIDGAQISGTAACNSYGGQLVVVGGALEVKDLGQTAMACVNETAMDAEFLFVSALMDMESIKLVGDELLITGRGVELRFTELAPPPTAD